MWKGDILVAGIEGAGENLEASEVHARRLNAKEILTPKSDENFLFPIADGNSQIELEEPRISGNPPQYGNNPKEAKNSEMIFEENRTGLNR